ncbi:unnamed protein product [Amaranthus hypochondriacus]
MQRFKPHFTASNLALIIFILLASFVSANNADVQKSSLWFSSYRESDGHTREIPIGRDHGKRIRDFLYPSPPLPNMKHHEVMPPPQQPPPLPYAPPLESQPQPTFDYNYLHNP